MLSAEIHLIMSHRLAEKPHSSAVPVLDFSDTDRDMLAATYLVHRNWGTLRIPSQPWLEA